MKAVRNGTLRTFLVLGMVSIMAGSAFAASNIYDFTLPSIDGKPMPLLRERKSRNRRAETAPSANR